MAKRKGNGNGERPQMTAEEARSFDRISTANILVLTEAARLRGCSCEPYRDWFTYNRWRAQGYQVQRGEHGTPLTVMIQHEKREAGPDGEECVTTVSRPWTAHVFCRCQVAPKNGETVSGS